MDTNFFGVVNVTRAALPLLREQGSGHIIQVSSIGGRTGTPGLTAYQASKWAVGGFSEALAQEIAPFGIKVTIVEPGGMRTDWAGSSMRVDPVKPPYEATIGAFQKHIRASVSGAQSDPAKVARAIVELAAAPDPPLHLLLGSDAVFLARIVGAARAAEDAKWGRLSLSTDYAELGDFKDSPRRRCSSSCGASGVVERARRCTPQRPHEATVGSRCVTRPLAARTRRSDAGERWRSPASSACAASSPPGTKRPPRRTRPP